MFRYCAFFSSLLSCVPAEQECSTGRCFLSVSAVEKCLSLQHVAKLEEDLTVPHGVYQDICMEVTPAPATNMHVRVSRVRCGSTKLVNRLTPMQTLLGDFPKRDFMLLVFFFAGGVGGKGIVRLQRVRKSGGKTLSCS